MKFTICLVLLAGSALLASCGDQLKCDADTAQEVRIAAGAELKEALVSQNYPKKYPNNACQRWNIMAEENQCIEINTGDAYFNTEEEMDWVFVKDMGSGKQTYLTGEYIKKNIHEFTSETNNVVVEFISDEDVRAKGFKLDLKSIPCLQGSITETYEGSEYTLIAKKQNYETSRQACVDLGGHLAVITSEQEHNFISDMIKNAANSLNAANIQDTWIGLYQKTGNNEDLQWVDGTPFVLNDPGYYKPWLKNDPNEYGWGGVRLLAGTFVFADKHPWAKYWAMCEKSVD